MASVGERVRVGDHRATVRFVGQVPGTSGEWYGVEWDDATRGKHDGTHEGTRYFECRGPKAGSFVRPKKVTRGVALAAAIRARYEHQSAPEDAHVTLHDADFNAVDVEVVNGAKIENRVKQLDRLMEAVVAGDDVGDVPPGDLRQLVPRLKALDLSQNLVCEWATVADIGRGAPNLRSLVLNHNRMEPVPAGKAEAWAGQAFASLRRLLICNMAITWPMSVRVAAASPELEELHVCEDVIQSLSSTPDELGGQLGTLLPQLKLLNLYGNLISSWQDVCQLAALPRLETLLLNSNQLGDWPEDLPVPSFPCLSSLALGHNEISSWATVRRLGQLGPVKELRIRNNRLGQGLRESEARKLAIVHLPNVESLNGSSVTPRERLVAERFFLEHFSSEYHAAASGSALASFYARQPEYQVLVARHGAPEAPIAISTNALQDRLLRIVASRGLDPATEFDVAVDVPPSMTVGQLKRMLQRKRHLDVPMNRQRVYLWDAERNLKLPLDDSLRQLSFYSLPKEARLLVDHAPQDEF